MEFKGKDDSFRSDSQNVDRDVLDGFTKVNQA